MRCADTSISSITTLFRHFCGEEEVVNAVVNELWSKSPWSAESHYITFESFVRTLAEVLVAISKNVIPTSSIWFHVLDDNQDGVIDEHDLDRVLVVSIYTYE